MRIIAKMALLPVIAVVTVDWLLSALASRIYSITHGFLWVLLLIPIILACCFQMWQNAMVFLALGIAGYIILLGMTVVEVLLDTLRAMLLNVVAV